MKKHVFITVFLLLLIPRLSFAVKQDGSIVKGIVKDDTNAPVLFTKVILHNLSDSSFYKGDITDENGAFLFEEVQNGKYYLVVQMYGMKGTVINDIIIDSSEQLINLGEIIIQVKSVTLETVNVIAKRPFIERYADKTVVNIENSIIQSNVSAGEMLSKLPGVTVNRDGNISLNGKQGVIILIDGKNTGLTGQGLTNYLKGLNSSNIQRVEIITNPSSKYDAAGNAGIINIILKRNKTQGFNGSVNTNYSQGRYPKMSNGFNLNYKNKWYSLFLYYSFDYRKEFTHLTLNRKFYDNDSLMGIFDTDDYITGQNQTHSPRIGADFNLSQRTTLSILGSSQFLTEKSNAFDRTNNLDNNLNKIYTTEFKNKSLANNLNYSFNTELKNQIDTIGQEVKLNLDYSNYDNTINQEYSTIYYLPDGSTMNQEKLIGDHHDKLSLYSAKLDYTKPFRNKTNIEAGIKSSLVNSKNNMRFYDNSNDNSFDSLKSSIFDYSENINSGYINFNKEYKKITFQGGLRGEHTLANGHQHIGDISFRRNYIQLFPTFYAAYKINDKHGFNANVGRRIDRPAYDQMNPFKKILNPTTFMQGNSNLKPQFSYLSELSYSYKNQLFITIGASTTTNNITEVLVQDATTKMTYQTVINLDKFNYYSINISFVKKIKDWWTTNTNFQSYYGVYTGTVNNVSLNKKMPSFDFHSNNIFSIKEGLSLELGFKYYYKIFYGTTVIKPLNNLSFGIQQSVLNKQGTIILNVSDIFWGAYARGTTESGSVVESWDAKRDTRTINFSFSYKFGKGQLGSIRKTTGSDDEKNRVQ